MKKKGTLQSNTHTISVCRIVLLSHNIEGRHSVFELSFTTAGDHASATLILGFTLQIVSPHRIVLGSFHHIVNKSAT